MARDRDAQQDPARAGSREATMFLRPEDVADLQPRLPDKRTRLRVSLLETRESRAPHQNGPGEIGAGFLVDRLAVGAPLRIALEGAPAFETSSVRGIQRLGPDAIQVITGNSVYRLDRCEDPPEVHAEAQPAPQPQADATGMVPLSQPGSLGGASQLDRERMRIARIKTHDPGSERLGDLGYGRVLDRLAEGQVVRFSIEGGPTFVTSPVRIIRRLGTDVLEIETTNSTYRLKKPDPVS